MYGSLLDVKGLTVSSIRGFVTDKRCTKYVEPQYILFSDGETLIELEEQDYYAYHDCASSARHINVWKDAVRWERINDNDEGNFPEATTDF